MAFAAVLALAPAAEARKFSGRFKFPSSRSGFQAPTNGGYIPNAPIRQVSTVQCTAVSYTKNFKRSVDAHVAAITEAFAYACDNQPQAGYAYKIKEAMRHASAQYDAGLAYAKAISAAETECTASGNAWGCAAAYAYSAAWADAVVSAHATAWSEAIALCDCDFNGQEVATTTDALAWELRHLNAEVSSYSEAHVCVDRDEAKFDFSAQTCVQDIYATVFAKSVSLAVLTGKCYPKDVAVGDADIGEFLSIATAEAKAEINTYEIEGCVGEIDLYNPYH